MMSLAINHNLMAANAARYLNSHYGRLSTSIERLSSGLRVNSAADDAAGLAIRELMRADIAALNQGVRNANDAISMLQVADGALAIIDEKLIRMKELAEQAATGTYDSTQRLMIDSEFQAMGAEIDRIANATDFNGIKLLNGSLSGAHDGSGLNAKGAMKIHFGTLNDSAEDYYYVDIGDCSTAGLGLHDGKPVKPVAPMPQPGPIQVSLNNWDDDRSNEAKMPGTGLDTLQNHFSTQGTWYVAYNSTGGACNNFGFIIPAGTKNIILNLCGAATSGNGGSGHNSLELFTMNGLHLAGTTQDDYAWTYSGAGLADTPHLPFRPDQLDDSQLNTGPAIYDPTGAALAYSAYNGMTIGYSGDPDRHDSAPNDGKAQDWGDYQIITIDEAKEDLLVLMPGVASAVLKAYYDGDAQIPDQADAGDGDMVSIKTQAGAQSALVRIDDAIVKKDKIRAHLGALQNRLENTVSNLTVQAENLQAAESRISDADAAIEMTNFVRNQILTQSAVAMLSQANSMPQMAVQLIGG